MQRVAWVAQCGDQGSDPVAQRGVGRLRDRALRRRGRCGGELAGRARERLHDLADLGLLGGRLRRPSAVAVRLLLDPLILFFHAASYSLGARRSGLSLTPRLRWWSLAASYSLGARRSGQRRNTSAIIAAAARALGWRGRDRK